MTLAAIIQEARDLISEPNVNPTADGKFSRQWWTRKVNTAQRLLARRVGYKIARHPVAIAAYVQESALPTSLCWGILGVTIGTTPLNALTEGEATEGWRYQSEFANQGGTTGIGTISVYSDDAADTTQTVTLKGITTAGVYVTEDISVTGTAKADSATTTYQELWYAELDAECDGILTIAKKESGPTYSTMTTIAAGDTTAGTDISSSKPTEYLLERPNIVWATMPDAAYTAWIKGGSLPDDFATPTSLGSGCTVNIATLSGSAIATVNMSGGAAGSGYAVGDVLTLAGGTGGTVTVGAVTNTGVTSVTLTTAGTGYTTGVKATTNGSEAEPDSLPAEWHTVLAEGAAALAETADLASAEAQGRLSVIGQAFVGGMADLEVYLNTMSRDRTNQVAVENDWYGDME
jgi:hypothetical protein